MTLSQRTNLRRGPHERGRYQQQHGEFFHAGRVAVPEQVGQRRELAPPQRRGEHETQQEQARGITEGIGGAVRDTAAVNLAGGADAGLGAEPGGEDREGGEAETEAAAGQQVIALAAHAPRHEKHDQQLECHVAEDADQQRGHKRLYQVLDPTIGNHVSLRCRQALAQYYTSGLVHEDAFGY